VNGADHVIETHEVCSPKDGEDYSANKGTDKAFDRLLGRKLDKRRTAHGYTPYVSKAVVANNERGWHPEPDETFKDIIHDKVTSILLSI